MNDIFLFKVILSDSKDFENAASSSVLCLILRCQSHQVTWAWVTLLFRADGQQQMAHDGTINM